MMKAIAIASIALLSPTISAANEACENIAYMAEQIMTARQLGVPFGTAYAITQKPEFSVIRNMVEETVILAYEVPAYSTPLYRQAAINEFRDEMHITCIKASR